MEKRKSEQFLVPVKKEESPVGMYDLYPSLRLETGRIGTGIESLIQKLSNQKILILDGYVGVFYDKIRGQVDREFNKLGKKVCWFDINSALKPENEIDKMLEPFLGGDDPISPCAPLNRAYVVKTVTRSAFGPGHVKIASLLSSKTPGRASLTTRLLRFSNVSTQSVRRDNLAIIPVLV